ncbi:NAD(P)-dependent methylenetetrahydromethanopterin dehydrogenase [Schlesneria sp. T3-172]|uniref:NAD(P)-dependent methylenetetrahydromethanopterin dehydrogenase n=1 Tax=Schlesneria sphaerica TaxID=3373610 RepID=UPI0037CB4BAE
MKKILIQLDTDSLPSSFDRVVAVDAGVDELFSYGGVTPDNVETLVHGAIFTRKPSDLVNTAIFVGGSNVAAGEALLKAVTKSLFGPFKVSVMMDSNGSNTTAAATVLAASRHLDLSKTTAVVLGGTGPVGSRVAQLLLQQGATVRLASRSLERSTATCAGLKEIADVSKLSPHESQSDAGLAAACEGVDLVVAAGAAKTRLINAEQLSKISTLKVAIDLNAVAPAGIEGIEVMDKAREAGQTILYGAVGVGGTKMKIHYAAVRKLFTSNTLVLDTAAIYDLGASLS